MHRPTRVGVAWDMDAWLTWDGSSHARATRVGVRRKQAIETHSPKLLMAQVEKEKNAKSRVEQAEERCSALEEELAGEWLSSLSSLAPLSSLCLPSTYI